MMTTMMMTITERLEAVAERLEALEEARRFTAFGASSADKGGGKRKRRTAYTSGRRELLGMRRKRLSNVRKTTQKLFKRSKKKALWSQTGIRRRSRFKRY